MRRAAVAGLGVSSDPATTTVLLALARSGDDGLARSALLALGEHRDRRALPALLEDALLGRAPIAAAALLALDAWASGAPPPDEARAIEGTRLELDALLSALEPPRSGADTSVLWRDDARLVSGALIAALGDGPERRLAALEALDARRDGPGVGLLLEDGATALPPATAAALTAVAVATRDAVAARLDDDLVAVRALALRVLAKFGDARVTARRVARAAAGLPEEQAAAVAVARRWAASSPADARALADELTAAFADTGGARPPERAWEARLGLVAALAATGVPGTAGLQRALGDASFLVRSAAATALGPPDHAESSPRP